MNRIILLLTLFSLSSLVSGQDLGIKSNFVYLATTTPNLALELKTGEKTSLDAVVGYNPWSFKDNKKIKHILVQPEFRYWPCETFNGHFFGVHAHGAYYNAGNVKLPFDLIKPLREYRYQGYLIGGGVSYGYQWILGNHWNLEATVGLGYAYLNYDKYNCLTCGQWEAQEDYHYFGPTRLGLSIVYIFK